MDEYLLRRSSRPLRKWESIREELYTTALTFEEQPAGPLPPLTRREMKAARKARFDADIRLALLKGSKPGALSRYYGVPVEHIYGLQRKAKVQAKAQAKREVHPDGRKTNASSAAVSAAIAKLIPTDSMRGFSLLKLRRELLLSADNDESAAYVPSYATIQRTVKKLGLRYLNRGNAQQANYTDPKWDEQRLWVSRILTSSLLKEHILVSVDECCFKQTHAKKQWRRGTDVARDYAEGAERAEARPSAQKTPAMSFNVLAAITQDRVAALQIVEGTTDALLFEAFMGKLLMSLREDPTTGNRPIVVQLDNVGFHKTDMVKATIKAFGVTCLFSAAYSPEMNPIEQLFGYCKRQLRSTKYAPRSKREMVTLIKQSALRANQDGAVASMWRFAIRKWQEKLRRGEQIARRARHLLAEANASSSARCQPSSADTH